MCSLFGKPLGEQGVELVRGHANGFLECGVPVPFDRHQPIDVEQDIDACLLNQKLDCQVSHAVEIRRPRRGTRILHLIKRRRGLIGDADPEVAFLGIRGVVVAPLIFRCRISGAALVEPGSGTMGIPLCL